ncbi:MAG: DUF2249 domain-containing protein [bacterium]|nr:DUF2249 domain-containing protein [bacterium]
MSPRHSSERRRREIVEATLALLANTPIHGITTRAVARRVGVSQPALFRHFRSRDEILEAVVVHTREQLEILAVDVLRPDRPPLEALDSLFRRVVGYARAHPGMPRLLFYDAATPSDAPHHQPLRHLVSMQRALVSELIRQAQRSGELRESIDPELAGSLFVAQIQGVLLQWQLSGRGSELEEQVDALLALWRAGLAAGEPQRRAEPILEAQDSEARDSEQADAIQDDPITCTLSFLDVRPILEQGRDPLSRILDRLDQLPSDGVLKLIAPFRPGPLLSLLGGRGYRLSARELEPGLWGVEIQPPGAAEIADYCDLEAPLPLERILEATPGLESGDALLARVPREPRMLFPHLKERGLTWEVHREFDGSALICVRRPK